MRSRQGREGTFELWDLLTGFCFILRLTTFEQPFGKMQNSAVSRSCIFISAGCKLAQFFKAVCQQSLSVEFFKQVKWLVRASKAQ